MKLGGAVGDVDKLKADLSKSLADATQLRTELGDVDKLKADRAKFLADANQLRTELTTVTTEGSRLKSDLTAAQTKIADFEKLRLDYQALRTEHDKTSTSYAESQHLIALLQSEIEGNKRSNAALAGRTTEMERMMHLEAERRIAMTRYGFVARTRDRDDLTLVEGIGPKIEEILLAAHVDTYTKLAMTPVEEIRTLLDGAGANFKVSNPGTWPRQAALIVRGDWAELRRWQDELIGGVEMPPKSGV